MKRDEMHTICLKLKDLDLDYTDKIKFTDAILAEFSRLAAIEEAAREAMTGLLELTSYALARNPEYKDNKQNSANVFKLNERLNER